MRISINYLINSKLPTHFLGNEENLIVINK